MVLVVGISGVVLRLKFMIAILHKAAYREICNPRAALNLLLIILLVELCLRIDWMYNKTTLAMQPRMSRSDW